MYKEASTNDIIHFTSGRLYPFYCAVSNKHRFVLLVVHPHTVRQPLRHEFLRHQTRGSLVLDKELRTYEVGSRSRCSTVQECRDEAERVKIPQC